MFTFTPAALMRSQERKETTKKIHRYSYSAEICIAMLFSHCFCFSAKNRTRTYVPTRGTVLQTAAFDHFAIRAYVPIPTY